MKTTVTVAVNVFLVGIVVSLHSSANTSLQNEKRNLTFDNDESQCCNRAKKKKIVWLFTSVYNKKCLQFASLLGGCEVCLI